MRRFARMFLVSTACALAGACTAEDIGPEYFEISEEESELQFYGPGLAGGYRLFLTGEDSYYVRRTIATYGPLYGEFPFARMYIAETPPTRHFTRLLPAKDTVERWEWFQGKTIVTGASGSAVNGIGRIDFAVVTADGVACVVWVQAFGRREHPGVGTGVINGYYCRGAGPMMTVGEAKSIVKFIGHREHGVIAPPSDWSESISLRIRVTWTGGASGGDGVDGHILFSGDRDTGIIRIGAETGRDCEGVVSLDSEQNDGLNMLWGFSCADGVTASGKLTLDTANGDTRLTGRGTDSRGHEVRISL